VLVTALQLSDIREALDAAYVDEARVMVDPLAEGRLTRPLAEPDRQWVPVDAVNRVVDELAAATVAHASERQAELRTTTPRASRAREPDAVRQILDLLETLPTGHRTAATFRDDLVATLQRWRVRARAGKTHYWDDRGD
jgi:hypothetical protein